MKIVKLGEMTFDTFNWYPDVQDFLVSLCRFKPSEISKIEKDCLKAWCTVPKIEIYLDKQAKQSAKRQSNV